MKRLKLISSAEATPASKQITKPCSDCPWTRAALNGWLGGNTADEWIAMAHNEVHIECHVHPNVQCAGAAIYRTNVSKMLRDPSLLKLPADRETVFARPAEFLEHHAKLPPKKAMRGAIAAVGNISGRDLVIDARNGVIDKLDEVCKPSKLSKEQYLELLEELEEDIELRLYEVRRELAEEA